MEIPEDLKYSQTHEWAKKSGDIVRVGISYFAQKEISDVVHIELPEINMEVKKGQPAAVVESVKAAFDIYSPVDGVVVKVNDSIVDAPEKVNQDSYGEGWFFEVKPSKPEEDLKDLMDSSKYESFLSEKQPH